MRHGVSGAVLGDAFVGGERGAAEVAEIQSDDAVIRRAQTGGDALSGAQFVAVALAVIEAEGVAGKAGAQGVSKAGCRIEAAREEADGGSFHERCSLG